MLKGSRLHLKSIFVTLSEKADVHQDDLLMCGSHQMENPFSSPFLVHVKFAFSGKCGWKPHCSVREPVKAKKSNYCRTNWQKTQMVLIHGDTTGYYLFL